MLNHPDMCAASQATEAGFLSAELLGTATFLKPSFRIAVGPKTGQLSVVVQASAHASQRAERGTKARH